MELVNGNQKSSAPGLPLDFGSVNIGSTDGGEGGRAAAKRNIDLVEVEGSLPRTHVGEFLLHLQSFPPPRTR